MHKLYEIKDKLMKELEDYAGTNLSQMDKVKDVHMLSDAIKNIDKICMLNGSSQRMSHRGYSEGYSNDGYSNDGYSERYSNDGYSERRYSRASYDAAKDDVMERMERIISNAAPKDKEVLRRAMNQLM